MVSFLHIDGLLTQRGNKLDVETGSSSIVFRSPSYSLANKLALRFKGRLLLADGLRRIGLRDAELLVNNLPFTADGFMVPATEDNPSRIDMTFGLKVSDMNDLLHFIPVNILRIGIKHLLRDVLFWKGISVEN